METVDSTQVYADEWLSVRRDTVRGPDRSTSSYTVVDAPDVALVVPVDGGRVRLVEQHRHAVGVRSWELPSGSIDPGEDPAAAAVRELREETGLTAASLVPLGVLHVTPSTLSQRCHVFHATQLTEGDPEPDADEHDLRSVWWSRDDLEQRMRDGSFVDAKSLAAYTLLLLREQGGPH